MKLCRFDLAGSPGVVRTGMVFGGKVYETDGSEAIAVHEAADARLLSPIGHPPSVRLFDPGGTGSDWAGLTEGRAASYDLAFAYLNASIGVGPQTELMPCSFSEDLNFKPCLAAVIGHAATLLTPEEADQAIIGITLVNVFFAADVDRIERVRGLPPARSHDVGFAVGPVVTTPDELDPTLLDDPNGRRYRLSITAQVNGDEVGRFETGDLPFTLAEAVSYASASAPIRSGDLICVCLGEALDGRSLGSADEVRVVSDRLGTLTNRVG